MKQDRISAAAAARAAVQRRFLEVQTAQQQQSLSSFAHELKLTQENIPPEKWPTPSGR